MDLLLTNTNIEGNIFYIIPKVETETVKLISQ